MNIFESYNAKKLIKLYLFFVLFLIFDLLFLISFSYAGGAVAKRQEAQKRMMQQRRQQQQAQSTMMQQRVQYEQTQKNAAMQKTMQNQQQIILEKQRDNKQLIERARQKDDEEEQRLEEQVKDVVDINDLMASFETSSKAWPLIIDQEAKSVVVSSYIDQYRRESIWISKSSVYYADLIDGISQQSPDMINQPLKQVLMILAVLEYDFNNGQDKDAMALKVLGNRNAVEQNKKRLGI